MRHCLSTLAPIGILLALAAATAACGTEAPTYGIVSVISNSQLAEMTGFEMIPGSADEAIVLTQRPPVAYRVNLEQLSGATEATDSLPIFADLRHLIPTSVGVEEGLLGVAFSPGFTEDGRVYFHYTADSADPPPGVSVLARFIVNERGVVDDDAQPDVLLEIRQPGLAHNGGQIAFDSDGLLYLALGEGHRATSPGGYSQDLSNLLGSILRIDVSGERGYTIPPDNPFVNLPEARPEIYAYGLRNPWRFSFDVETGDLWAGDVGEDSWEEVNRIVRGGNYGWMFMEGNECFRSSEDCDSTGLEPPRAVYAHDSEDGRCAIIGGFVYRGEALPKLNGFYVYADFCTGTIWAVNSGNESEPIVLVETGDQLTSFGVLPDGELVIVAWFRDIYRLVILE